MSEAIPYSRLVISRPWWRLVSVRPPDSQGRRRLRPDSLGDVGAACTVPKTLSHFGGGPPSRSRRRCQFVVTLRPRTLALPWGDGEGVPEIASMVPILPNQGRLRRMRGRWVPNGGLASAVVRGDTLAGGAQSSGQRHTSEHEWHLRECMLVVAHGRCRMVPWLLMCCGRGVPFVSRMMRVRRRES